MGDKYKTAVVGHCGQCGREMEVKRLTGSRRKKYCSGRCKTAAYRLRKSGAKNARDGISPENDISPVD